MTNLLAIVTAGVSVILLLPVIVFGDADDIAPTFSTSDAGPFGLLDRHSKYYRDWFPEPLRVEDTTINNELRFDWEHDEGRRSRSDGETVEMQKSFGDISVEIQLPYFSTVGQVADPDEGFETANSRGLGDLEIGVRVPLFQYLSSGALVDNTIGFNLEAGIPTNSPLSKNAEIGPGFFDDLAIGERFSVQTLFTFAHLFGSTGGERNSFEYGLAFGYAIEDEDFRIPHVERLVPIFEVVGETALDGSSAGHNALTATAGLRTEFKSIAGLQPQLGLGYVFPLDQGGREQLRWGAVVSVVFEF